MNRYVTVAIGLAAALAFTASAQAVYNDTISINISDGEGGTGDVPTTASGVDGDRDNWMNTPYEALRDGAGGYLEGSTHSGEALVDFRVSLYTGGWGAGGSWNNGGATDNTPEKSGWTLGTMPNEWGAVRHDIQVWAVPDSFLANGYDIYTLTGPDADTLSWTKFNATPIMTADSGLLTTLTDVDATHVGAAYQILAVGGPDEPEYHPGDANGDGIVDLQDFGDLKANFGLTIGAVWAQGNFNTDAAVDLQDFGILKDHFGHTSGDVPLSAVPEPATMSLLAIGALGLLRRKR